MAQDKALSAMNSGSIRKGSNAVLSHLWVSLRARLWGCADALCSLKLGPLVLRSHAFPHSPTATLKYR